ncbi:sigma-70 family RNA polymerase sigma factor [Eubacteriales bacterium OttesenSCG-928-N14]|nr:sigma-70 family RNA polymerase sigma factor [Eubacteriales bacterium OttesenSCG-928-N14]
MSQPSIGPHGRTDAAQVFDVYGDMVYRLALLRTRRRMEAEDIMQDVFVRYLHSAPAFAGEEHKKAWLIRVTINRTKSVMTSAYQRRVIPVDELFDAAHETLPSEVYEQVLALPQTMRTVIHLYYYEGYQTQEIADLIGKKDATVRSQLHRARQLLKQTLKESMENVF